MKEYKRLTERLNIETNEIGYQGDILQVLHRLAELEDKLENGTLIELPCAVGDMIYVINYDDKIEEVSVVDYSANKRGYILEVVNEDFLSKYFLYDFDFNKDWFLTKPKRKKN